MNKIKRPIARYYGGKWKIAEWIISYFPEHDIFGEWFCGMASITLKKRKSRVEIINDLSDEIYNLFMVLRNSPNELINALDLTPYSRTEFYKCFEFSECPIEQARRTIVLLSMSYSPSKIMGRFSGEGNPVKRDGAFFRSARNSRHNLPGSFNSIAEVIPLITERLKTVIVENKDAIELMAYYDSDKTLHYIDPPYLDRKDKRSVYAHEIGDEGHIRIYEATTKLKGMVIISGYENDLYNEMYKDWKCFKSTATTTKGTAIECIWMNEPCFKKQNIKTLF